MLHHYKLVCIGISIAANVKMLLKKSEKNKLTKPQKKKKKNNQKQTTKNPQTNQTVVLILNLQICMQFTWGLFSLQRS